jgi:hypothetical protein
LASKNIAAKLTQSAEKWNIVGSNLYPNISKVPTAFYHMRRTYGTISSIYIMKKDITFFIVAMTSHNSHRK